MSDGRLSPTTKALLAAARADAPSRGARTKMWTRASSAFGGAAGVAAGGTAAAATGAGAASGAANGAGGASGAVGALAGGAGTAMKVLSLGTLLGGTVTVGVAAVLLHVGAARAPDARAKGVTPVVAVAAPGANPHAPAAADRDPGAQAPLLAASVAPPPAEVPAATHLGPGTAEESPVAAPPAPVAPALAAAASPAPSAAATHAARRGPVRRIEDSNSLSMEASLLAQARTALEDGDALSALRKARSARSLPVRQLVPEELSVEAQALRALGRDSEANLVDQTLRAQYPESALAR